jgi:hypothetical protein
MSRSPPLRLLNKIRLNAKKPVLQRAFFLFFPDLVDIFWHVRWMASSREGIGQNKKE